MLADFVIDQGTSIYELLYGKFLMEVDVLPDFMQAVVVYQSLMQ